MALFGKKDSIDEFSQMRQALKRAERVTDERAEENAMRPEGAKGPGENVQQSRESNQVNDKANGKAIDSLTTLPKEFTSIVSSGSTWQGNLKVDGSVCVEGRLSGEIDARETVLVAEGAEVDAKVRAAVVIVAGTFQGHVDCSSRLEITPTGKVRAELATKSLVVHEGASIDGEVRMTSDKSSSAPLHPKNGADRPMSVAPKHTDSVPLTIATVPGEATK